MKTIVNNVISLSLGESVSRLAAIISTMYLARVLAPASFGHIGFAMGLVSYAAILVNFGLDTIGTRQIARKEDDTFSIVATIVSIRSWLLLAAIVGLLIFLFIAAVPAERSVVTRLYGLILLGQAFSLQWYYRGLERMKLVAAASSLGALASMLAILFLVRDSGDAAIGATLLAASFIVQAAILLFMYLKEGGKLRAAVGTRRRALASASFPIFISLLAATVYHNMDVIVLGFLKSAEDVGRYAAVYRIHTAAIIPAALLLASFFPSLAQAAHDETERRTIASRFTRSMFLIGIPLAGFLCCAPAESIALVFGGEYIAAAPPLRLLGFNTVLVYINMAIGNPLTAWDKQMTYMWCIVAGAVTNVAANFLLIPHYGMTGAAIATIVSEAIVCLAFLITSSSTGSKLDVALLLRVSIPTAIASLAVASLSSFHLNAVVLFVLYAFLIGVLFLASRAVRLSELRALYESLVSVRDSRR